MDHSGDLFPVSVFEALYHFFHFSAENVQLELSPVLDYVFGRCPETSQKILRTKQFEGWQVPPSLEHLTLPITISGYTMSALEIFYRCEPAYAHAARTILHRDALRVGDTIAGALTLHNTQRRLLGEPLVTAPPCLVKEVYVQGTPSSVSLAFLTPWDRGHCATMLYCTSLSPSVIRAARGSKTCVGHRNAVTALSVLGCDNFLSTSLDSTIRVWDTSTEGLARTTLSGHRGPVWQCCEIPQTNSTLVSSVGADRTLRVWDVHGEVCVRVVRTSACSELVSVAGLSANTVVVCDTLGQATLHDVREKKEVRRYADSSFRTHSVHAAGDGDHTLFFLSGDGAVLIYSLENDKARGILVPGQEGHHLFHTVFPARWEGVSYVVGVARKGALFWKMEHLLGTRRAEGCEVSIVEHGAEFRAPPATTLLHGRVRRDEGDEPELDVALTF